VLVCWRRGRMNRCSGGEGWFVGCSGGEGSGGEGYFVGCSVVRGAGVFEVRSKLKQTQ